MSFKGRKKHIFSNFFLNILNELFYSNFLAYEGTSFLEMFNDRHFLTGSIDTKMTVK